ncbi:PREDICTED: uncharacterized protein LOC109130826 [Camelina sativa]|uniref:Uncharacterized protein LOC109130826 n=1 Tax=Camelina sativa TaxID=90675 RepID=A0ABM1RBP8_CAMSA|nr:PREDICTED: uncharacterized protein LOC109130826 [Camelina sativa]
MTRLSEGEPSTKFSTAKTWLFLNPVGQRVDWCQAVWFKGRIPRHAFISWVNSRGRLPTRDRLITWGLNVSPLCLLCNAHDESRQHLFFDCSVASEVWTYFTSKANVSAPTSFEATLTWLKNPCPDKNVALILRLAYQATVYFVWKERNSRLHNATSKSIPALILEVKSVIRCHLDPLSRAQRISSPADSFLVLWFGMFH